MRPYPKILRTTAAADATLRAYAARAHLAPFEALILAIGLLRTKDEREDAAERAHKFAALWHALARAIWRRWQNACHLHDRMRDERDQAADGRDAAARAADTLRADLARLTEERKADLRAAVIAGEELASAREATRRADQALESSHRSNRILAGRADAAEAEVARLTRELALERDAAAHAARLAVMREEERDAARSELAEALAALATKGATDRIAERVETIAVDVDRRPSATPCACALPDDFEAKLAERAPGWKGTLPELRARVIALGFSRYDALATDAAKRAAERAR